MHYITRDNFAKFLAGLSNDYTVFVPVKAGRQLFYSKLAEAEGNFVVGEVRACEPLKSFFTKAQERVAVGFNPTLPNSFSKPFAVVGVKACDLASFKIQDYVFNNHDYPDPFYQKLRQDNLIISADCTCVIDSCFCLALGVEPYPHKNFDLNLSSVEGGFLAESASAKGEKLTAQYSLFFRQPREDLRNEREERRRKIIEAVKENMRKNDVRHKDNFSGIVQKSYHAPIWEEEVKTCVECGACNTSCPTCHCFLLYDQKQEDKMERLRIWDSCLLRGFARVAGGGNPRKKLWMRLRNRFEKKFDFFPKVAGEYACTGCGRCIAACPAKIDIRKVLAKLIDYAKDK